MTENTGLCQCGCGQPTPVAARNRPERQQVKGEPIKFLHGHNRRRGSLADRFWAKVDHSAGTDACWPWTATLHRTGYGQISLGRGNILKAHRVAWELTYGEIPPGLFILHRCDNPPCCNPAHLVPGTCADNAADMVAKGRSLTGERNHAAKLRQVDVDEIRRLRLVGDADVRWAARRYGVAPSTVRDIVKQRTWRRSPSIA